MWASGLWASRQQLWLERSLGAGGDEQGAQAGLHGDLARCLWGCLLPLARSLQVLHTALPRPEDSLLMP